VEWAADIDHQTRVPELIASQQQIHFRMHLIRQTGLFGGAHRRPSKVLLTPVGHKQADRVVQFSLKCRWNRLSK